MANQIEILVKANADSAKKAFGSLTEQIAANRKKIGMGLTGIGAGITGLAALSIKAAQEEAIGISKLDQALKNVGTSYDSNKASIEEVISATQRKTNFGDEEQREVLTKLVTVLGDEEKALKALPAVLDASAASGKSAGTVAETMSKFFAGVANTSDAVGISVDKSADFTDRLGQVMEKVGGQAEATADPFVQFKNRTGDLSQEFGKVLLPIMTDLAGLLDRLTQKVIDFTSKHPNLTKWLGIGAAAFGAIALIVGPLLLVLPGLAMAFTAVGVAVNIAMGPVGLIVLTIAAVTAGVILLWKNWDSVWNNIKKLTQTVANFVIGLLNKLTLVWRKQTTFMLDMIAKLVSLGSKLPGVGDKFESAAKAIEGFSDKLDEGIPTIDLTSEKTGEMGDAFDEADRTIETANRGITDSTDRMADDVGAALDETVAKRISTADLFKEIQASQTKAAFEAEQERLNDVKEAFKEQVRITETETKAINDSWKQYRLDNDEIMVALENAQMGFADVMEELAIKHGMSLDDMALALEQAKVKQGDLAGLMSSRWGQEVDQQLIDGARLTDGLLLEADRLAQRRLEIESASFSELESMISSNNRALEDARNKAALQSVGVLDQLQGALIGEPTHIADDVIEAGLNQAAAAKASAPRSNAAIFSAAGSDLMAAYNAQFMAKGGIVTRPTLAMIGESGPEAVIPLGRGGGGGSMNVTVNIAEGAVVGVDDLTDTIAQTVRDVAERGGFRGVF
ncbi:tail tape measure protein [uncultured Mediterranean phage uvDeep-CGR2-KM23-C198]|nr:tail tape measure protein [uncultured Mediterranean phage uvDeep-CGR2-KM23-C198]